MKSTHTARVRSLKTRFIVVALSAALFQSNTVMASQDTCPPCHDYDKYSGDCIPWQGYKCSGQPGPWSLWSPIYGDGPCGECDSQTRTRSLPSCIPSSDPCSTCTASIVMEYSQTRIFTQIPPSGWDTFLCWAVAALGVGGAAAGTLAACFTAGVFTGGFACYAAIAAVIAATPAANCMLNECLGGTCQYQDTTSLSTTTCN